MNNSLTKLSDIIDEISMGPFGSDIKVENFLKQTIRPYSPPIFIN
jgi:hypothetical protein